jgi:hypothetical protein
MTHRRGGPRVSGDPTRVGLFTGAGISSGPPARLPLGRTFHRLLRQACEAQARAFAPDVVDDRVLAALRGGNWNLLARIENTLPGAGRGALRAMRVELPNEEHLLAAIHLARGGYHVTVNFDDGVELAYGLLAGRRWLSEEFPEVSEAVLEWRRYFPASAPELAVAFRPDQFATRHYRSRPLLVKLHGSLGESPDGVALSLPLITDEPDILDLGIARRAALDELARHPFVLVTGFSGGDPASTSPVMQCLGRTSFAWVAPEVRDGVRDAVSGLDPSQPQIGLAAATFRSVLAVNPPPWPAGPNGTPFNVRFNAWIEALPATVGAEVVGWSLADGGHAEEAVELLDRVARADGRTRTRLRLADALARRSAPGDLKVAQRLLLRLLVSADPDVRRVASLRLAGHLADRRQSRTAMVAWLPAQLTMAGLTAAADLGAAPRARTRATAVRAQSSLHLLERELAGKGSVEGWRAPALHAATRTLRQVRGALSDSAGEPSGRHRVQLRRQAVELRAITAIIRARPLPTSTLNELDKLQDLYVHLSDQRGQADTVATRALVLATRGARASARAALSEAERLGASQTLIELAAAALAARDERSRIQAEGTGSDSAAISSTTSSSTSSSVPTSTSSSVP